MKFILLVLSYFFFFINNICSQDIEKFSDSDHYRYLTGFADSSSGQFFIMLDSLPDNIYYPHNIIWDDGKWKLQIILPGDSLSVNLKPAITQNGLLFFINPNLTEKKFLIFHDGKWTYSDLPPQN